MRIINYLILSSFLSIFIFFNSCSGYKPIFSSANLNFEISSYSIKGDKILGNKIYSRLSSLSESRKYDQNTKSVDLAIEISKVKNATAKNSAGKILQYKITLNTDVKVTDFITRDKILNQIFVSSLTYGVQNKYSDTVNLENRTIENLLNKTYQELVIQLAQNIRLK